jgi:hypothetical protein
MSYLTGIGSPPGITVLEGLTRNQNGTSSIGNDDDLDLSAMNMDDDMGADGEGYYKAQMPEFFTGIHDPQGEYLSILNNYKMASGMAPSTNLLDSSRANQGSMFLPPGAIAHMSAPTPTSPPPPPPPGLLANPPPGFAHVISPSGIHHPPVQLSYASAIAISSQNSEEEEEGKVEASNHIPPFMYIIYMVFIKRSERRGCCAFDACASSENRSYREAV